MENDSITLNFYFTGIFDNSSDHIEAVVDFQRRSMSMVGRDIDPVHAENIKAPFSMNLSA